MASIGCAGLVLGSQPHAQPLGLDLAVGVEGRIAVAVAERERLVAERGGGLAVTHQHERGRPGWWLVPPLAEALRRFVAVMSGQCSWSPVWIGAR